MVCMRRFISIRFALTIVLAPVLAMSLSKAVTTASQKTGVLIVSSSSDCVLDIDQEKKVQLRAGESTELPLPAGLHMLEASAAARTFFSRRIVLGEGERLQIAIAEPPSPAVQAALKQMASGCWVSETKGRTMREECPLDTTESWMVCFLSDFNDPAHLTGTLNINRMELLASGDVTLNQLSGCLQKSKGAGIQFVERQADVRAAGSEPIAISAPIKRCNPADCAGFSKEPLQGRIEVQGGELWLIPASGQKIVLRKYERK